MTTTADDIERLLTDTNYDPNVVEPFLNAILTLLGHVKEMREALADVMETIEAGSGSTIGYEEQNKIIAASAPLAALAEKVGQ